MNIINIKNTYQHFNNMPYELKIFKKNEEIDKNIIKHQSSGGRINYNTDVLE